MSWCLEWWAIPFFFPYKVWKNCYQLYGIKYAITYNDDDFFLTIVRILSPGYMPNRGGGKLPKHRELVMNSTIQTNILSKRASG